MKRPISFSCKWDNAEVIPVSTLESAGISFYQAHTDSNAMAIIAEAKKKIERDSLCRIPFCVTVEAQALGANVIIPDNETGPTLRGYNFTSLEQLAQLEEIDLSRGRINEVLKCAQILKERGNVVAVNVEGPFTILGLLIDSVELFKGIYLHRQQLEKVLTIIENSIVKYMVAAAKHGAKIISYADPTGARELVGLKLFDEISGRSTYRILKKVESQLTGAVVHICGITSLSLEKSGFCTAKPVQVADVMTYGEGICQVQNQNKTVKILGHNCMKSTPAVLKNPVVWQIEPR